MAKDKLACSTDKPHILRGRKCAKAMVVGRIIDGEGDERLLPCIAASMDLPNGVRVGWC
jgi:hypothetical protein